MDAGVAADKVVVGKPVTSCKQGESGHVDPVDLGGWAAKATQDLAWDAGIFALDYTSDKDGHFIVAFKAAYEAVISIPPPPPPEEPEEPTNPPEEPEEPTNPEEPTTPVDPDSSISST